MKYSTYILFIFLLIFAGSDKIYANSSFNHNVSVSLNKFAKGHPIKFTNKNHNSILIQDTDIELEEECDQTNNSKSSAFNKNKFERFLISNHFYSQQFSQLNLDNFLNKTIKHQLFSTNSIPIYVILQVFRI